MFLWRSYGLGQYMDGYLKFINPKDFQEFVDEHLEDIGYQYIPVAVTAFGDLIVWKLQDEGYLEIYDFRHGVFKVMCTHDGFGLLFDDDLIDESYVWGQLNATNFREAVAKLGVPAYDQCFGYVPLLALGGPERVENLQIVNLPVHMEIMAQVVGPL
ncbi:MAG: DUF1851 domain-containing protein, partial [Cytophagaceae bacterium]